jgi:hypothetical protein
MRKEVHGSVGSRPIGRSPLLADREQTSSTPAGGQAARRQVLATPGLVSFWDFAEPAGEDRVAQGPNAYRLREVAGPIDRVEDGIFGPRAALVQPGQYFMIPRAQCPALNLHGEAAEVTVVAWIKRRRQPLPWCDAIAGMWDEARHQRQYCLFMALGLSDVRSNHQVCGHISGTGGWTPGMDKCDEAASGATPTPHDAWVCAGMTYDGVTVRAYLDGVLDANGRRNPYHYTGGIHDGGTGGSDFTVAAVRLPPVNTAPIFDRARGMGNFFSGLIGGLAVFNRALEPRVMASIAFTPAAAMRQRTGEEAAAAHLSPPVGAK